MTFSEFLFTERLHRYGYVLLFALGIGKTEINKLDLVLLYHFQYFCDDHGVLLIKMPNVVVFRVNTKIAESMPLKSAH